MARAHEWWEHKLALLAGVGYATAYMADVSLLRACGAIASVLAGVVAGAVFVSVLNDLTDREIDLRAGKPNRLAGRPAWIGPVAILICLATGAAFAAIVWRGQPVALALYAAAWLTFAAYSVPPLRLKVRGLACGRGVA